MECLLKEKINALTSRTLRIATLVIIIIAVGIFLILSGFFVFQQTIIRQQEEQMLTVSKSVASSISIYINGYMSDMMVLRSSSNFINAYQTYVKTGDSTALVQCMEGYTNVRPSTITGVCMLSNSGKYLFGTDEAKKYATRPIKHTSSQMLYFTSDEGEYCIGIALPVYQSYWLVCLLNISDMYQKIGSDVRMGNTGYVMIMASDGFILMNPETSQVGKNIKSIFSESYSKKDSRNLKSLSYKQQCGESGVAVLNLHNAGSNKKVRKLNAFTSAWLRDDFLIVCTVADYSTMISPLHAAMVRILVDALVIFSGASGLLILLIHQQMKHRHFTEEIRTLQEVNLSLEELHEQENQIQHSQRLQTIGTLTGGIAHEFNNLLTPIMGYSGMMVMNLPEGSEQREDAEEIYHSAEKAKEIIQQITALSRKNNDPAFQRINLKKLGDRVEKIANSVMPENISLGVDIVFEHAVLLGNESQISQVVLNLCANAINAIGSKEDGHLQISGKLLPAQLLPVAVQRKNGCQQYAVLSFTDNGCGIEPRLQERIFEPFFTTKQTGQGTGLGLSIVQSIIENHGGRILVESTPGEGSTFTVYLPTALDNGQTEPEPPLSQSPVVLVDNNPRLLHLLEKYLAHRGYLTATFQRPREALDYIQSHHCSALITDYSMPEMTGTQLAVSVRRTCPQICILLLTSQVEQEIVEYKLRGIIEDYMLKPVSCKDTETRLAEILEKSAQQRRDQPNHQRKHPNAGKPRENREHTAASRLKAHRDS